MDTRTFYGRHIRRPARYIVSEAIPDDGNASDIEDFPSDND